MSSFKFKFQVVLATGKCSKIGTLKVSSRNKAVTFAPCVKNLEKDLGLPYPAYLKGKIIKRGEKGGYSLICRFKNSGLAIEKKTKIGYYPDELKRFSIFTSLHSQKPDLHNPTTIYVICAIKNGPKLIKWLDRNV